MNVPQLRFKEFNQHDFLVTKFGEIIHSSKYGPRFDAKDYSPNGNVRTIRGTDISSDGAIGYDAVPLALLDEKTVNEHQLKHGDLVVITTADCGVTGIFLKQDIPYIASAYAVKITLNMKGYPVFFKYYFQTKSIKNEVEKYIRKATISNLPMSDISKFRIGLPTLPEQTKIANFLTTIDERINQLTRKKELMTQYKQGVMQQIFSQQLRFKDDNGEDFGDWEEKKLGELCKITTGKLDANAMVAGGKYRFYTCAKDFYHIDKYAFDTNALLISGNGANVGYIHHFNGKFNAYQRTYVLDGFNDNIIFVKFYLDLKLSARIATEKKEGNTPYIVMNTLTDMPIFLPCIPEQTKIAHFLTALDEKIQHITQQIEATKQYKQGLLQQMFV